MVARAPSPAHHEDLASGGWPILSVKTNLEIGCPTLPPGFGGGWGFSQSEIRFENQKCLVTPTRNLRHRQRFPNLLNSTRDIEGVVSLMHITLPHVGPSSLSGRSSKPLSQPVRLVGFLRFTGFSVGPVGQPGVGLSGAGPRSPTPGAIGTVCGISRFSGLFSGTCGKTGGGMSGNSELSTRNSALSTRNSELRTRNSELVYQLTNYIAQLSTVFPQVTWA